MKFGFIPKEGGSDFAGVIEEVTYAEEIGFNSCMLTEHHGTSDHYWGAPLVRLGAIASHTQKLDLVTGVLILPLRNPAELAEKIATLDVMSEGRVTIGCGLGYVESEFDAFNIPLKDRAGRLIEGFKFLDTALSADGEFSFESEFFSCEDWEVIPSAWQEPRPALWNGGWGDKALQRSVKFADEWVPGLTADITGLKTRQDKLARFAEEAGRDWESFDLPLQREAIVAETHEEAIRLGEEHLYESHVGEYGSDEWSHPVISQEAVTDFEALRQERFLVGTPTEVVEQIEKFRDNLDIGQMFLRLHHPGMDHQATMTQIELIGHEVIPTFN